MTVAHQRNDTSVSADRFPVGMRVLAVDDDPTCLKVLESLLRKCQYQGIYAPLIQFHNTIFIEFLWELVFYLSLSVL